MLAFASWFHPLVCESLGRRAAGSGFGAVRQVEIELIKSLKNLSQLFGIAGLCFQYLVSLWDSAVERAGGLRAAGCGRRPLIALVHWRHVGVNRHKVTTLRRVLSETSRPDSARRPAGHACSRHTVQAICIAEAKKHSRDARAIRYARTYLALGASGVPPIDGAADASAG